MQKKLKYKNFHIKLFDVFKRESFYYFRWYYDSENSILNLNPSNLRTSDVSDAEAQGGEEYDEEGQICDLESRIGGESVNHQSNGREVEVDIKEIERYRQTWKR